jgi:hypothetical protein
MLKSKYFIYVVFGLIILLMVLREEMIMSGNSLKISASTFQLLSAQPPPQTFFHLCKWVYPSV